MHLGYLESRTSFERKKRHCVSTGLIKLQDKDKMGSLQISLRTFYITRFPRCR